MESIGSFAFATIGHVKSVNPLSALRSPLLWGITGVSAGVTLFFRGFPFLKRKRLIQNTPTSTVRGASLGAVEVSGTVVGPYTLISPLSELDCFYYRALARGTPVDGDKTQAKEETLFAPFFLDDGTGRLMIDPRGAEMQLPPSVEEEYSPSSSGGLTRQFLGRHGLSSGESASLVEFCIREGDKLFVVGTLRENPATSAGDSSTNAPAIAPGFLSGAAADLQRRSALESMFQVDYPVPAPKEPGKAESFDLNPPAVLMKGASGEPFFISQRSQREVIEELAWRSVLYIWGGPILALAGLWLLLDRLLL